MKKFSLITLFLLVIFISAFLFQCRKVGDVISGLDRSFKGTADSAVYASFYDNNTVATADAAPDVNDIVRFRGVQTILHENCATSNCHGGPISPKFNTYAEVMRYITPGSPGNSKIWDFITTNNFDHAMPPVNSNHEVSVTDKTIIYNWIINGAKERPDYNDFRPAAIALMRSGCGSANCHNEATATGGWARNGLIPGLTSADTITYVYTAPGTGAKTYYCLLSNTTLLNQVLNAYKDSVRKFYSDTLLYANYRPYKTFSTPVSALSTRGPMNTYDDILFDVQYPKSARSNSSVQFTDPVTLKKFYVKGNYLNVTSTLVSRIDSTLLLANPYTGVYAATADGSMAYQDGGLKPNEVALIKAWYFADPNIPDVWKYGNGNAGIFKYKKSGTIIKR